jgi:hypothetical protein
MAAFASSYIKTEGSQVTRAADAASMTGANFTSWYRADEGTLYGDGIPRGISAGGASAFMSFSDNTTTTFTTLRILDTGVANFQVRSNNVNQASIIVGSGLTSAMQIKTIGAYMVDNFAASVNGNVVVTDTSGTLPLVSRALIGATGTSSLNLFNGTIKKIAYYPVKLSSANLQALTS